LYWNTVNEILKTAILNLMRAPEFSLFRLVGGTALSLQLGHRMSVDIDLFTDATYGTVDFERIEEFLTKHYTYIDPGFGTLPGMGKSYLIGENSDNAIKLDIYYTESFIQPVIIIDEVRLATIEEIIAMKIDVIARGGRKKDFWDIHELIDTYSIQQMLSLHKQRYEFTHIETEILEKFTDFSTANDDFEPLCLRDKFWELVKLDIDMKISEYKKSKANT
jgi:hypothetical protein